MLAIPVAPQDALEVVRKGADEVGLPSMPEPFRAVGLHYVDFEQVSDEEVVGLLHASEHNLVAS